MRREEYTVSITPYTLHGSWFLPDGEVRATAHLIHGQGDFTSRYHEVAQVFCAHGVAVCGVDFPGHGKSTGKRGDIPSLSLVEDIHHQVTAKIKTRFPDVPRGLLGHSMGGLVALGALVNAPTEYSFSWISSPLLKPVKNKPAWQVFFLRRLAMLAPQLTVNTGVKRAFCRRLPKESALTHKKNPLFHKRISLRWGAAVLRLAEVVELQSPSVQVETRVLLTQGSQDQITPLRYAESFISQCAWPHLRMEVIPNALHEPFRDLSRKECFLLLEEWLEKELSLV